MQRSGTTFLHATLNKRPDTVLFHHELWAEEFFGNFIQGWIHNENGYFCASHIWFALLQWQIDAEMLNPLALRFNGAKANFNSHKSIEKIAKGWSQGFPQIKPIGIIRSDQIAKLGSHLRAQRTGNWHQWTANDDPGSNFSVRIKLDVHAKMYIISSILANRKLRDFVYSLNGLLLSYEEDLLKSPESCIRKIECFLGMMPYQYDFTKHTKLSPPPEQYIEDYHKLCRYSESLERLASAALELEFFRLERKARLYDGLKYYYKRLLVKIKRT
jgi:hypothetical protein